jgi:hypothetical protein
MENSSFDSAQDERDFGMGKNVGHASSVTYKVFGVKNEQKDSMGGFLILDGGWGGSFDFDVRKAGQFSGDKLWRAVSKSRRI